MKTIRAGWNTPLLIFPAVLLGWVLLGTGLLLLPGMIVPGGSLTGHQAFLTAVSATTLTGIRIVTLTDFTLLGQWVLIVLMHAGLWTVLWAAFTMALHPRLSGHSRAAVALATSTGTRSRLLPRIIGITLAIELAGSLLIYGSLGNDNPWTDAGSGLFFAWFQAVSAFTQTGFTLLEGGMQHPFIRHHYVLQLLLAALVCLGAIGFTTMWDSLHPARLRERLHHPERKPYFSTRQNINFTVALVVLGAVWLFIQERNGAFRDMRFTEAAISAVFHSATARTAGFSTVPVQHWAPGSWMLLLLLMGIGGAPLSPAGGIKIPAVAALLRPLERLLPVRPRPVPGLQTALVLVGFFGAAILVGTALLMLTERTLLEAGFLHWTDLLFRQTAAITTAGISGNSTAHFTTGSLNILAASMLIGRAGPLLIVYYLQVRAARGTVGSTHHLWMG
ncbi:MAG: potassium transporter TrkG [Bacteroidota bacterium]